MRCAWAGWGRVQLLTGLADSPYAERDCDWRLAVEERGMQLHFLPLDEATRHLTERGCVVYWKRPCGTRVHPRPRVDGHCVTFAKVVW